MGFPSPMFEYIATIAHVGEALCAIWIRQSAGASPSIHSSFDILTDQNTGPYL
jgi:hypothetical protein